MTSLRKRSLDGRLLWQTEGRRLLRAICGEVHGDEIQPLADRIGVHRSDVSRWLAGITRPTSPEALAGCEAIGIVLRAWIVSPVHNVQPCTDESAIVQSSAVDAA
jgi:DNA-binding transcriptional regulator YdaS (Cro superfamily)